MPSKIAKKRIGNMSKRINKANIKGNVKKATRIAKRQSKIVKTGKTGVGRTIDKAKKVADKIKRSKLGKIVTAASKVYSNVKKGKVKGAIDSGKELVSAVKAKRTTPKIAKAGKIQRANQGPGKRAGAARTSAVRKLKAADRKISKVTGAARGLKGKAKRKPIKVANQKQFGKKGAKAQKLIGKIQSLSGSKKRVAKRTKHLTKRLNRNTNSQRKKK